MSRFQRLRRHFGAAPSLCTALAIALIACGNTNHTSGDKPGKENVAPQSPKKQTSDGVSAMGEQATTPQDLGVGAGGEPVPGAPSWDGIRVAVHAQSGEVLGSEKRSLLEVVKSLGAEAELKELSPKEVAQYAGTSSKLVLVALHPIRHSDGKRFSGGIAEVSAYRDGLKFFTHVVEPLAESDYVQYGSNELPVGALAQAAPSLKEVLR